jgi:hypothetical protein
VKFLELLEKVLDVTEGNHLLYIELPLRQTFYLTNLVFLMLDIGYEDAITTARQSVVFPCVFVVSGYMPGVPPSLLDLERVEESNH